MLRRGNERGCARTREASVGTSARDITRKGWKSRAERAARVQEGGCGLLMRTAKSENAIGAERNAGGVIDWPARRGLVLFVGNVSFDFCN